MMTDKAAKQKDAILRCVRFRCEMSEPTETERRKKAEFILLGTRQQLDKVNLIQRPWWCQSRVSNKVACFGITVDGERTFAVHIKCPAGRCSYQLCQLRTVRRSLAVEAARTLVHAFVISRMDYCNSVFGSTCSNHHQTLQSVLNATARLMVKKQTYDHITASLHDELHWLPAHYRFIYCVRLQGVHNVAPSYLVDRCVPVSINVVCRGLRLATNYNLLYPRTRLVRYDDRSFAIIGPNTWNHHPPELRDPTRSPDVFCKRIKTILFE